VTPSKPRRPGTRSRGLPPQRRSPAVEAAGDDPASRSGTGVPTVVDLTSAGSVALVGRQVAFVGIGHELDDEAAASRGLGIAEHLARTAENVTVIVGVAHRPSWRRIARRARVLRPRPPAPVPGRPHLVRVDYTLGPDQTVVTRAVYEATHLARAALAEMPGPPDLVVATTPGLGGVVAAARVARRFGAPLVVVVHDLLATPPGDPPGNLEGTGALAALERHALSTADQVVITNESFREGVLGHGITPARIHLVPTWSELEPSPLARRQARERLGWPTRGQLVVLAAPRGARTDVATVLEAVRRLHRRDVRFVLLSDPAHEGGTRRLLAEQAADLPVVRLGEPASTDQLPLMLAAADVVLVCERRDAAETALIGSVASAFAAGRPVVAAARPGGATAVEVDRSGGAGLTVAAGSAAALAQALAAVLDNPDRRLAMADQAVAHARQALGYRAAMKVMDGVVEAAVWPWMRHI